MNETLSLNTQAILLLTAPLILGKGQSTPGPDASALTQSEYSRLALALRERAREPADLLASDSDALSRELNPIISTERLRQLLGRGFLLSQAVERWRARGIWLVSRADSEYPTRLRQRLQEKMPPILYGCGDRSLLDSGSLAVVGSRAADEELLSYSAQVGQIAAHARIAIVSGGARGVDLAAMNGALSAGGQAIGVLAENLERAVVQREHREFLLAHDLLLVSPYDPAAGFNVGNAMQRNKIIYALSNAALVVCSDLGKGGTWAGAIEQIEKHRFVPVYVRPHASSESGLVALRRKGALLWREPQNNAEVKELILKHGFLSEPRTQQATSLFGQGPTEEEILTSDAPYPATAKQHSQTDNVTIEKSSSDSNPADELYSTARRLVYSIALKPKTDEEIAGELRVSKSQIKEWLQRMIGEKSIVKLKRPVRYQAVIPQADLFQEQE